MRCINKAYSMSKKFIFLSLIFLILNLLGFQKCNAEIISSIPYSTSLFPGFIETDSDSGKIFVLVRGKIIVLDENTLMADKEFLIDKSSAFFSLDRENKTITVFEYTYRNTCGEDGCEDEENESPVNVINTNPSIRVKVISSEDGTTINAFEARTIDKVLSITEDKGSYENQIEISSSLFLTPSYVRKINKNKYLLNAYYDYSVFSNNNQYGTYELIILEDSIKLLKFNFSFPVERIEVNEYSHKLHIKHQNEEKISIFNTDTNKIEKTIGLKSSFQKVVFKNNKTYYLCGGNIYIVDDSNLSVSKINTGGIDLVVSPSTNEIIISQGNSLQIIDMGKSKLIKTINLESLGYGSLFLDNINKKLFFNEYPLYVIDLITYKIVDSIDVFPPIGVVTGIRMFDNKSGKFYIIDENKLAIIKYPKNKPQELVINKQIKEISSKLSIFEKSFKKDYFEITRDIKAILKETNYIAKLPLENYSYKRQKYLEILCERAIGNSSKLCFNNTVFYNDTCGEIKLLDGTSFSHISEVTNLLYKLKTLISRKMAIKNTNDTKDTEDSDI